MKFIIFYELVVPFDFLFLLSVATEDVLVGSRMSCIRSDQKMQAKLVVGGLIPKQVETKSLAKPYLIFL